VRPHVEDCLGLHLAQFPAGDHFGLGVVALADDPDHLVEIDVDDDLAAQDLHAAGDGGQPMTAAPVTSVTRPRKSGLEPIGPVLSSQRPAPGRRDKAVETTASNSRSSANH
jgi:hypothetical protein